MEINIPDAEVEYLPNFLSSQVAEMLFLELHKAVKWEQNTYNFGGKEVAVPRLTAWFGDDVYKYSGIVKLPNPWTSELDLIRKILKPIGNFNSVLLNLYRDGNDSVSWHSDDEKELGVDPVIASLSLGETRQFELKHKINKTPVIKFALEDRSLLVMRQGTQINYRHRIPKEGKVTKPRINLTFRYMFKEQYDN